MGAGKGQDMGLSEQKIDQLISTINSMEQNNTNIIDQFVRTTTQLTAQVEKVTEQIAETQKQTAQLLVRNEADKERNDTLFNNIMKTSEEMGASLVKIREDSITLSHNVERNTEQLSGLKSIYGRIKALEMDEARREAYDDKVDKLDEKTNDIASRLSQLERDKEFLAGGNQVSQRYTDRFLAQWKNVLMVIILIASTVSALYYRDQAVTTTKPPQTTGGP